MKTGKLTRSPEALTATLLRDHGWVVEKCSWWEAHTKHRRDLFGFADLIAFSGSTVLLVQATTWDHIAHRIRKIEENPLARSWMNDPTGTRGIWVVGWRHVLHEGAECKVMDMRCYPDGTFGHLYLAIAKEKP